MNLLLHVRIPKAKQTAQGLVDRFDKLINNVNLRKILNIR